MEITPAAVGVYRFDSEDSEVCLSFCQLIIGLQAHASPASPFPQVCSWSPQVEVRALVEGQFLSRRLHAEKLGYSISKNPKCSSFMTEL